MLGGKRYKSTRRAYHTAKRWLKENVFLRRLTKSIRVLPDFIIVGAQKSGTTFLYNLLSQNRKVVPAQKKEVHFFDVNYDRGLKWYRSHFPTSLRMNIQSGLITGEASPYYLYHPHVAGRIARTIPNVRLIILLRDPVDRAISHYWHEVKRLGTEELPMEKAFSREEERLKGEKRKLQKDRNYYSFKHHHYSYKDRGKYTRQIHRYRKYFSSDNIHIIKSEYLFKKTNKVLRNVESFLGIQKGSVHETSSIYSLEYPRPDKDIRNKLEHEFKEEKERLKNQIGVSFS